MKSFDVIIVANGRGVRAGFDKLSAECGDNTVLERTVSCFLNIENIDNIIVVRDNYSREGIICTSGGVARAESVKKGLCLAKSDFVLIHDGARPFVSKELIKRIMKETAYSGSAIPALKITDTLITECADGLRQVDREKFFTVQTPQGFITENLRRAYENCSNPHTDDAGVYGEFFPLHYTDGETGNKKITYYGDLFGLNCRVGTGYDVHMFTEGKPLILGGVHIPHPHGLLAHSDGDVVIHALMDALLSACGMLDIGFLFPDNDPAFKDIDSGILLRKVAEILKEKNVSLVNASVTVMAQSPRLSGHIPQMIKKMADTLECTPEKISVSATTTESLGIIGENKGIAALAVVSMI